MRVPCHVLAQRHALEARIAIALCGKGGEPFAPPCFARAALCRRRTTCRPTWRTSATRRTLCSW
eukprot:1095086-Lingulodinium_polyedra.AAC.1